MANLKKPNGKSNMDEVAKAIEAAEADNVRTLEGDIEVGEDGCVHDIPLLAGYVDDDGVLQSTFSYREMTGRDEEAINRGDVRANGAKVVNIICERCVTEIGTLKKKEVGATKWGQIIRSMLGGDLDYMSFKIRELSKGKEIEFTHKCPDCGTKLKTIVNTDEFGIKPFLGQSVIDFTLQRGYADGKGQIYKEGHLRLPNGFDREIVVPQFKKNYSTATSLLLSRLISFDGGAVVSQKNVTEMSLRDRGILEDLLKENTFGLDTEVEIYCDTCGADLSGDVGQSNFF